MVLINRVPLKLRFLLVGGTNTAISYLLFLVFLCLIGKNHYQLSLALAWLASSFVSFTLQKLIVFQTVGRWWAEYVRCLMSWAIAYLINAILLETFVSLLVVSPVVAQLIAVSTTTVLTFFLFKYFAFRNGGSNG